MDDQVRLALKPTDDEIRALPLSQNSKIVVELLGKSVGRALDIGCGDGKFTRLLAGLSSQTSGVDVKANKIEEAAKAAQAAGVAIDFRTASGQELPYENASFNVVAFSNSLNHMPDPAAALREAVRVLKPGGVLYVMEPVPSGNYHEATRLVNDETIVRTDAYRSLDKLAEHGMQSQREIMYRARRTYANFENWRADQIDRDLKRKALFDAQPEEVRRRFESNADREPDGGLGFDQVFRVNLLRKTA